MGENKRVATKRMGNFDMASAGDRILAFWEKYPNGKILTDHDEIDKDGLRIFKSYIWKDKASWLEALKSSPTGLDKDTMKMVLLESSDVDAPAKQPEGKEGKKDFEKLDTVSVGRALAKMGFLKDGQVASDEELEDRQYYKDYVQDRIERESDEAILALSESSDLNSLASVWASIPGNVKAVKRVIEKKDEYKTVLLEKEAAKKKKADK